MTSTINDDILKDLIGSLPWVIVTEKENDINITLAGHPDATAGHFEVIISHIVAFTARKFNKDVDTIMDMISQHLDEYETEITTLQ